MLVNIKIFTIAIGIGIGQTTLICLNKIEKLQGGTTLSSVEEVCGGARGVQSTTPL